MADKISAIVFMKKNHLSILLILPAVIVSCAFFLLPVVQLLQLSLVDGGAQSYIQILTRPLYLKSLFFNRSAFCPSHSCEFSGGYDQWAVFDAL